MNQVLIIDKAAGMTSHDVINSARRILGLRSIGHLGTLDPAATGVLPLVIGNFTRLAQFYLGAEKQYEGVIRLGFATDTFDAEGDPVGLEHAVDGITEDQVREAASRFLGKIEQMPPPFSAKKIRGVPAYKLARKQQEVHLDPVTVEVHELEILSLEGVRVRFRARVGSGTYMRSIAHDVGKALSCAGHLESLRRTAHGEFTLAGAHTLEEVAAAAAEVDAGRNAAALDELFLHPRKLLPKIPSVTANEDQIALIRHGRAVNLPEMSKSQYVKVFQGQMELIAIAARVAGTLFHPKIVFATEDPSTDGKGKQPVEAESRQD
jgi:tRNA pseudouridine55 synthase